MTNVSITEEQLQNILQAALTAAAGTAQRGDERPRVKNPERPEVDLGFSETQWAFFIDEWGIYKRRASLRAEHLTDELRACCSKDLRKTLFDFVGSTTLASLSETELLKKIEASAVIGKKGLFTEKSFMRSFKHPTSR